MKILLKTVAFSFVLFVSKTNIVLGQVGSGNVGVSVDFTGWLENVFVWIIGLAGVIATGVLIFSAYLYITASGDEQKIQKATKGITYAIVGLVVAAIAFLIVNFVIDGIQFN